MDQPKENNIQSIDVKYHKLATEYSKIRGQATVLKRALLEEQQKSSTMRETLRIKETALRRAEQEVDSLGFRNKQLEHRVASLQEDLAHETKLVKSKFSKNKNDQQLSSAITNRNSSSTSSNANDSIFTEELQKKIIENAQLISLLADKDADIDLLEKRLNDLEQQLTKCVSDHTDAERKLRKEIEILISKNSALETKIAESSSIVGSEDALSVSECEHTSATPIHRNSTILNGSQQQSEERIFQLEKEVFHWKTKYEICKISTNNANDDKSLQIINNGPSSSSNDDYMSMDANESSLAKEQLIYNHFMKKLDALFEEKNLAESKLHSYIIECESLGNNLEIVSNNLSDMEHKYNETHQSWHLAEEDLATTRVNYEEQISVLTEQVISLSDQLAELK